MMFEKTDFNRMRDWLYSLSGPFEVKRARVNLFDRYRYREDYEAIYNFIIEMGGALED